MSSWPRLALILGGARSGKSRRAEQLAVASGLPVVFVATCLTRNLDAAMQERLRQHRERRPAAWPTVENRLDLHNVARAWPACLLLVDCLTLWVAARLEDTPSDAAILNELAGFLDAVEAGGHALIVSNEVGQTPVPADALTRRFVDLAGQANQQVAARAAHVEWTVAGIPMTLKGEPR